MILYDRVKQSKCKTMLNLFSGKGNFHNVFGDRPITWSIAKKNTHPNMHPQLINMDLQECMIIKCV